MAPAIVPYVTSALSALTVLGDLLLLSWLAMLALRKRVPFDRYRIPFAFLVSVLATGGSLFFSEVAGYEPCKLCWFQRIFMYPQVFLLGIALLRRKEDIAIYLLPLNLIGAAIASYNYYIQVAASQAAVCVAGVSCTIRYVFQFGYVTIPMMALTAFLLILAALAGNRFIRRPAGKTHG
jgi:disulfide bond formation protein DsbB